MAKKRSKKDKIRAQSRHKLKQKNTAKADSARTARNKSAGSKGKPIIFNYDPKLIWQDLAKTLLVTLIVLVVLALLALRYT